MSSIQNDDQKVEEFWKECVKNVSAAYIRLHGQEAYISRHPSFSREVKAECILALSDMLTEGYKERYCK